MRKLHRLFATASAVVMLVVVVVLGALYYRQTVDGLVQMAENQNILVTRALSHLVQSRFAGFLANAPLLGPARLRESRELREIDSMLDPLRSDLSILKVRIFGPTGMIVYSSDQTEIGENAGDSATAAAVARRGSPRSVLSFKDRIAALSGEKVNRDVVETYIPVRDSDRRTAGVFLVAADVTASKDRIEDTFLMMVAQLVTVLLALYGALILIVRYRVIAPISRASDRATEIGPQSPGMRLPLDDIPAEVAPLVYAVNGALDRMERALDAQRQFAADAAHELLTPLAVLMANLDTVEDRRSVASLRQDVEEVTDVVTQLLRLAELEGLGAPPTEPVDVRGLAADSVARMAPLAVKQGRSIALTGVERPVMVLCEARGFTGALRNLIKNAIAVTAPGTTVEVEIAEDGAVRVIDCGPGVPPAEREAIFERFRRGRNASGPGAGLGLSIVKRFVETYGGTVEVGDAPGGGAVFTLHLPRAP